MQARPEPVVAAASSGNAGVILTAGVWYVNDARSASPDDYVIANPSGGYMIDTAVSSGLAVSLTSGVAFLTT